MKHFLIRAAVLACAAAALLLLVPSLSPRPAPAQAPPARGDADAAAALALSAPAQAPAAKKPYDGPCACGNGCPCGNSCGCATTAGCSGKGACDCTSRLRTKDPRVCTHCVCGCTETGHCDCKDCDHPKLAAGKKSSGRDAWQRAVDAGKPYLVWVGGFACPYCEEGIDGVHAHVESYRGDDTPRVEIGRPDGKGDVDHCGTITGSCSCERIRAVLARPAAGYVPSPACSGGCAAPPGFFGGCPSCAGGGFAPVMGGGCPGGFCGGGGCGPGGCASCGSCGSGGCGSCGGRRR